jgi:kynurenine--oxoglutarate transaminase/cysteine-S-conjugate beta-lyase/glutamine--phenylpyruvate transaminase
LTCPVPCLHSSHLSASPAAIYSPHFHLTPTPFILLLLLDRYSVTLQRPLNWETEVTIGVGATEVLYSTMQSLIDPGDEAVLITPAFDIYAPQVQMAGGVCKFVSLRLKEGVWGLDMGELRAALSPRTRVLLLNNPQNPSGKIMGREELLAVSALLQDFPQCVVVCDDVYEHMVYDGADFPRMATLPGMWERTLTVSSSGKTFSCTGWKIGWAVGPEALIRGLVLTNQWVQFSVSTPSQAAIAEAMGVAAQPYQGFPTYYAWLLAEYTRKRDILMAGLKAAGLNPTAPDGGFFIVGDTSNIAFPEHYMTLTSKAAPVMKRDWAFCRFLTQDIKVGAIPPSAFFDGQFYCARFFLFRSPFTATHHSHSVISPPSCFFFNMFSTPQHFGAAEKDKDQAANMARFAFCKSDASLHEASKRLLALRELAIDKSKLPPLQ